MFTRILFGFLVLLFVSALPGNAAGTDGIKKYFSDTASKVKATEDPLQKRQILDKSFRAMSKALDKVSGSPGVSQADRKGIERFHSDLKLKQDELAGVNGFPRVPDAQLNAFSDYVVQDMEQAQQTVTISVVTLLLIIIIVLLLVG